MNQARKIIVFLEKNIPKHPGDIVAVTADKFNVSRVTVHRHLSKLIKQNKVIKSGSTRDTLYYLVDQFDRELKFRIDPSLDEYDCYQQYFENNLSFLPNNVKDICQYGFTEILNNAKDHSYGTDVKVSMNISNQNIIFQIEDNGIGIFKSICDYFRLDSLRESVFQLSKGKMTTDPSNHTGEGIFFSSRAFDLFEIFANGLHYYKNNLEKDWALASDEVHKTGSTVVMTIASHSTSDLVSIWKRYQDPESLSFDRTDITVELSRLGQEKLISRSQAKRVLKGLETRFKMITLDFKGVTLLGQGFADEVFRVFQNKHPDITFQTINTNEDVKFMIDRTLATNQS